MTVAFLINKMPTRMLDYQTPINVLSHFHSIPSLLNLPPKIFGCLCYVHVHSLLRDKLDPRALKCVFLGYPHLKKDTSFFILLRVRHTCLWMLKLVNRNHISQGEEQLPLFRERLEVRARRSCALNLNLKFSLVPTQGGGDIG